MKLFNHPLIRLLFALCIVFLPLVLLEGMISGELGILLGILVSFIAYIFYVKFWEKRPVYELRITNKSDSVIYKYFGLNSAFSEFVIGLLRLLARLNPIKIATNIKQMEKRTNIIE